MTELPALPAGFSLDPKPPPNLPPAGFSLDQADTTPIPAPVSEPVIPDEEGGALVLDFPEKIDPLIRLSADKGITFDQPSNGGHLLASFGYDDAERLNAYKLELGPGTKVRRGPDTKAIEYFDPDTKRYSLADPPGTFQTGSLAGPGVVMTPEIIGAGAAAIIFKHPVMVEMGAGGGAFIGEIMRLSIGHKLGINQKITDKQIVMSALKEGGIAFAGGVAFNNVVKLGKFILDVSRGRVFNKKTLDQMGIDMDHAVRLENEINDRIAAESFRFNLAQATGDENLLNMQEFYKRSILFSKDFAEFGDAQAAALKEFNETINKPYRSREADTLGRVKAVSDASLDRTRRQQDHFVASKEAELEQAITAIDDKPLESLGSVLRDVGDVQQQAFRDWSDEGAVALNKLAGGAEFIPNVATVKAVGELDAQTKRLLIDSLKGPQEFLVRGDKIVDPEAQFSFLELWDTLSALKRLSRVSSKGLSTETPDVGAVKKLIGAMESDLRQGTSKTALRDEYVKFIKRYQAEKARLDEGTVAKMMERRGGRNGTFHIADEDVFRGVIQPGGKREAQELHALIKSDPEALQGVRESIGDLYKKMVIKDGRGDPTAHKNFMRQYNAPMSVFFTKQEIGKIARTGGMEKALRAREEARKVALAALKDTTEGRILNFKRPGDLVRFVLDPKNPEAAHEITRILAKTPDVLRSVRNEARKEIAERMAGKFQNGERQLSAANLDTFLNGKSGEKGHALNILNLYGRQYLNDLQTLNSALKIAQREAKFPNRSNTAFWIDTVKNLSRAYVGLFTRPGRVITALDRIRARASNRVLVQAILNPKDLRKLMQLRGVDMRSQSATALVGAMGGTALLQDFE